jgi:hypothetical protein
MTEPNVVEIPVRDGFAEEYFGELARMVKANTSMITEVRIRSDSIAIVFAVPDGAEQWHVRRTLRDALVLVWDRVVGLRVVSGASSPAAELKPRFDVRSI